MQYGTMRQKVVSLTLVGALVMVSCMGCGGSAPNPVDRYMIGDEDKSCRALYAEVSNIDGEIVLKNKKITDREIWNVLLFAGGCFVIVPWFFIDCKKSYEVEIAALKARKNWLETVFADKNCSISAEPVAMGQ